MWASAFCIYSRQRRGLRRRLTRLALPYPLLLPPRRAAAPPAGTPKNLADRLAVGWFPSPETAAQSLASSFWWRSHLVARINMAASWEHCWAGAIILERFCATTVWKAAIHSAAELQFLLQQHDRLQHWQQRIEIGQRSLSTVDYKSTQCYTPWNIVWLYCRTNSMTRHSARCTGDLQTRRFSPGMICRCLASVICTSRFLPPFVPYIHNSVLN